MIREIASSNIFTFSGNDDKGKKTIPKKKIRKNNN